VQLHVTSPSDWYRISRDQILKIGGSGLLAAFGSLGQALRYAYPEFNWIKSKFLLRGKKSAQRWLCVVLSQLLPENTEMIEDFLHPDLLWGILSRFKCLHLQ